MPEPTHEERAGERVVREVPDRRSRGERYRANAVKETENVSDAVSNLADIVQAGVGAPRPTGQHVGTPPGDYYVRDHSGVGAPDLAMGVAAGVAMAAEAARGIRKRWVKKRGHSGNR